MDWKTWIITVAAAAAFLLVAIGGTVTVLDAEDRFPWQPVTPAPWHDAAYKHHLWHEGPAHAGGTVVLGSSRVMQVPANFNWGIPGARLDDPATILAHLGAEGSMPDQVWLGIDPGRLIEGAVPSHRTAPVLGGFHDKGNFVQWTVALTESWAPWRIQETAAQSLVHLGGPNPSKVRFNEAGIVTYVGLDETTNPGQGGGIAAAPFDSWNPDADLDPNQMALLDQITTYDVNITLFITPIHPDVAAARGGAYEALVGDLHARLLQFCPARVLDLHDPASFGAGADAFLDGSHLTADGARKLSEHLASGASDCSPT